MKAVLYRSESLVLRVRENIQNLTLAEFQELASFLSFFISYPDAEGEEPYAKHYIQTPDLLRKEILNYASNLRIVDNSGSHIKNIFWFEKPITWLDETSPDSEMTNAEYYSVDSKNMSSIDAVEPITVMFTVDRPGLLIRNDLDNTYIYNTAEKRVNSNYVVRQSQLDAIGVTALRNWMTARGYSGVAGTLKADLIDMVVAEFTKTQRYINDVE